MQVASMDETSANDAARRSAVAAILAADHRDLVAHIRAVAGAIPAHTALTHLERGEEAAASVSFTEMDRRARSLGAYFQHCAAGGSRAIMLFETGVEMVCAFLGCVYAGVIAAPLPAPPSGKLDRYLVRVKNVVVDGTARFVLTTANIKRKLQDIASTMAGFENVEWIAVDELADCADRWVHGAIQESDIAYLQYTSGSTSTPKGVIVTHRNLMKVIAYNGQVTGCPEFGTSTVCWMPYFHDYGLIDGTLVPLAHGMSVYLMSPFDFVQKPVRWVQAIDRYRASHSAGPNFSFALVAEKSTPEERALLDLSCWRRANNCAEPIRKRSVERFRETFMPHGLPAGALAPAYGLAEGTMQVTLAKNGPVYFEVDAGEFERNRIVLRAPGESTRTLVGCGQVWPGPWHVEVRIVDPETRRLAAQGTVGEVWIRGDLVAKGYWNRPEETAEKFHAEIDGMPGARYLRSGDLGFMVGEELVITGRRKDVIIVEGRNHYPQDLEMAAEQVSAALRSGCTIAFSVETEEQVRVVLVCEIREGYQLTDGDATDTGDAIPVPRKELERAIRRAISEEHQLRVHDIVILHRGLLPKTTSGKVERSGCKAKYMDGVLLQGVPRR